MRTRSVAMAALSLVGGLLAAAPAAAQPYAYVLGQRGTAGPGTTGMFVLNVIDGGTNTLTTSTEIGVSCHCMSNNALAISRDGSEVYVAVRSANAVVVVSTATNAVIETLGSAVVGVEPMAIAVSPDNSRLYVAGTIPASVKVIDRASRTLIGTIPLNVTLGSDMALSPDGSRLYVTTWASSVLKVIDTASLTVLQTLATGAWAESLDIAPDGTFVYVSNFSGHSVTVFETASGGTLATRSVANNPRGLAMSPTAPLALVGGVGEITVMSTLTHAVTSTIAAAGGHIALAFSANGQVAYATTSTGVRVVNPTTATVSTTVPFDAATAGQPGAIVTTPPPFTPPVNPPPTGLTVASIVGNAVTLRWTAPDGSSPTGYIVEGGVAPGQVLASLPTGGTATAFRFTAPNGAFRVRVHAQTTAGRSPASNEVPLFVNVATAPSAPAGLLGLANGSTMSLAWQSTFGGGAATAYRLDITGDFTGSLPLGPGEAFSFSGVPAGTYTLAVRAMNAAGISDPSNTVTLTFPGACSGAPSAPPAPTVIRTGRALSVSWTPAGAGPAPTSFVLVVSGAFNGELPTAGRTLGGTVGPGSYDLRVRAVNACGASADGAVTTVVVP